MTKSKLVASYVIIAAVSSVLASYLFPQVKIEERVVTKTVVVEKEVVKKDVVRTIKRTVAPDGTKTTEVSTTDKTVSQSESSAKQDSSSEKIVTPVQKSVLVTLGTKVQFDKQEYSLGINKRVLGPIFVGATATTQNVFHLNIGLEF